MHEIHGKERFGLTVRWNTLTQQGFLVLWLDDRTVFLTDGDIVGAVGFSNIDRYLKQRRKYERAVSWETEREKWVYSP